MKETKVDMGAVKNVITPEGFNNWLDEAEPGSVCCYHSGPDLRGMSRIAFEVYNAYLAGRIAPVQRRLTRSTDPRRAGTFAYLAIKRRRVVPIPCSPRLSYVGAY